MTTETRLPQDIKELEARWPRALADYLTQVRSRTEPEALAEELRRDVRFMALVAGWEMMPTAAQANAWNMIQERLWEAAMRSRPYCVRCGECCRQGSPALLEQDRPTLAKGAIGREDVMTQRAGERAYSNRERRVVTLAREQVKVREAPGGRGCIFLGPGGDACLIYADRPFQCRIMECWDPSRFDTVQSLPPLTRRGLLGEDHPLAPIMDEHDRRCAPAELGRLLEAAPADVEAALEMILFDLHVREFAADRFELSDGVAEFVFGRPLAGICRDFGYIFQADAEGRPSLVRDPGCVLAETAP